MPWLTVPSTDLPLRWEAMHIVLLLLPQNHTAMLQQQSIAQCSNHLRIKKLMEKLYRATKHHLTMFAYVCYLFTFFLVCLLVFEWERDTPKICGNFSSKFNYMLPYFCSGRRGKNLHLPSPAFRTHPFMSDSSRAE